MNKLGINSIMYIQIFYEFFYTEIRTWIKARFVTSVGDKKPNPNLPIWLFTFLDKLQFKKEI